MFPMARLHFSDLVAADTEHFIICEIKTINNIYQSYRTNLTVITCKILMMM